MGKNKGITLVALVITVIILLILAGVALSLITGQEGLFEKARGAAETYNESLQNEQNATNNLLAMINSITDGTVSGGNTEGEGGSTGGESGNTTGGDTPSPTPSPTPDPFASNNLADIVKKGEVPVTKKYVTDDNSEIVVPAGATVLDMTKNASEGIVIDINGSEFVWVPVADPLTMYTNLSTPIRTVYGNEISKKGKLYNENGSLITAYNEPALLSDNYYGDAAMAGIDSLRNVVGLTGTDNEVLTEFERRLINDFNEMIISVVENKGFYIGRYETSVDGNGKVQSKRGVTSAKMSWYAFYQGQKDFSINNNLGSIGSTMIWGSQYDQMMIWMRTTGTNVANYTGWNSNQNRTNITGNVESDKINNIYDLYGNSFELTLEAMDNVRRTYRGGDDSSDDGMPAYRGEGIRVNDYAWNSCGSRITLYISNT